MPELYQGGIISENVFSFYLTGREDSSYMDFGAPDTSVMTSESDLTWIDGTGYGGWWTNNVYGWRWSSDPTTEYSTGTVLALTDTGTSCIYGPSGAINFIFDELLSRIEGSTFESCSWGTIFSCSEVSNMPAFELLFGDHWF